MKIKNLNKGGKIMSRESKLNLSDFVNGDRFELNSYLTYLLKQFYDNFPEQSEDRMVKQ
jgi:hypothetical protein